MNLLSWAGAGAKRLENTVNNDLVKPVQRVAAPVVQRAQGAVAQINPLDSGRTYNTVAQRGASYAPNPVASALQQVTHNGVTNATGSLLNNVTGIPSVIDAGRLGVAQLTHNQGAKDNAVASLAKNLPRFLPVGMTESFKNGFGQDIATAATAPFAEHSAQQQADYARKIFNNKSSDPLHNSAVEEYANAVQNDLLNQHLGTVGLNQNTPTSQVIKKVGGDAVQTAANIALTSKLPGIAKTTGLVKPALTYGGINAASGAAGAIADPNSTPLDIAKQAGLGFVSGAGIPAAFHLAPKILPGVSSVASKGPAAAEKVNNVTAAGAAKVDKQWRTLDKRTNDAVERASNAPTAVERKSAKVEAQSLIQQRNARLKEIQDKINNIPVGLSTRDVSPTSDKSLPGSSPLPEVTNTSRPGVSPTVLNDLPHAQVPLASETLATEPQISAPPQLQPAIAPPQLPINQEVNSLTNNAINPPQMPANFLAQDPADIQAARILNISKAKAAEARASLAPPELKPVVNKPLSKMPPPQAEVPKSSAVHGNDLKPMQNLPTINKLFSNKLNVLRKINTPSSHALADKLTQVEAGRQGTTADWMRQIPTVQKLNKTEMKNFADSVEKNGKPSSPKVDQAVKEWQKLTPKIAQAGKDQAILIGEQKNYFPHNYPVIKRGSSKWDAQIQYLMDTKRIDHQTASNLLDERSNNRDVAPGHFGNFENARLGSMPGYHKDIQAVTNYVGGAAERIARAQHLGVDNQVANKLLDNIRIEGGDINSARDAVQNYLHNPDKGLGSATLGKARSAFGAASLSKAPISHLGQTSNTAVEAGIGNTLKGWAQHLARNPENRDFVAKTGVNNPQELHSYRDQYTSVKGLASKITAKGLTPVMRMNRSVTALAGRAYGNHLASVGDTTKLAGLGVTGKIGKTLTPAQEVQAGRGLVNHDMFSGSRATTPTYAETPIGKTVGQFRTAYAYKQTGFIHDRVIKEARNGNLAPLARYLGVSAGIGAGTIAVKNKISGRKESKSGVITDTLGALGGIPGELAVQTAKYGIGRAGNLTNTIAGELAPLAGEGITLGGNVDSAIHGKFAPAGRTALKSIPIVGGRISSAVLPSKTGANAPAKTPTVADSPDIKTLRANPPKGYTLQQTSDGKYAYTLNDGTVQTSKDKQSARTAIAEDSLKNSNQSYRTVGDTVYRKAEDGSVTKTTKTKFDYQVGTATLVAQKNAGDVSGYLDTANKQLDSIQKQLQDPNIDPLDALTLQNDATSLQDNIAKYSSYGGFTKPKSGKSTLSSTLAALKSTNAAIKPPTPPKVSTASVKYKSPTIKKFSAPKSSLAKTGISVRKGIVA